jgi:hypothetical protein
MKYSDPEKSSAIFLGRKVKIWTILKAEVFKASFYLDYFLLCNKPSCKTSNSWNFSWPFLFTLVNNTNCRALTEAVLTILP